MMTMDDYKLNIETPLIQVVSAFQRSDEQCVIFLLLNKTKI